MPLPLVAAAAALAFANVSSSSSEMMAASLTAAAAATASRASNMKTTTISAAAAVQPTYISATDPRVWVGGRTSANSDSTRSFDWEGVSFHLNIQKTSFVQIVINTTGPMTRLFSQISYNNGITWFEQSSLWVTPRNVPENNTYWIADDLDSNQNYTIRVFNDLEPAFSDAAGGGGYFNFIAFGIDGIAVAATPPVRKLEIVGDSISAGYGSRGSAQTPGCPVNDFTSGNYATYNHIICDTLAILCSVVAWSGKGMYQNCCDSGERMPAYYLQTRGGENYATDWDFTQFVPDAILINLGTNDFGHDAGPAWEANFSATYTEFVLNATQRYGNIKMPVFYAQGPMNNSPALMNALNVSIMQVNAAGGNAVYLDMRGPPCDGCGGHPGVMGHAGMAQMAIPVIAQVMNWS